MTYYGSKWAEDIYNGVKSNVDFLMSIRDNPKDNQFSEWLYGSWDKEKYDRYKLLNAIPGISHYMDYLLDIRADNEYLNRYGMDYSDIHDPRKLSQTGSSAVLGGYAYHFVSKNVNRLYH